MKLELRVAGRAYGDEFAFGGRKRWPVRETKSCLQRVEISLEFGLLRQSRWLLRAAVVSKLAQLRLCTGQGVVRRSILEPRTLLSDPFEQIGRETLVLGHHLFVLLINTQDFADATGGLLGLRSRTERS